MSMMNANAAATTTMTANEPLDFELPEIGEAEFSNEELAEDMDGLTMSFPRIKIPAGGVLQFEIPNGDPQHPDYRPTLTGVILYNHASCANWPEGDEYNDDVPPLCSSVDGKQGYGEPGGTCATCTLSQFGSASNGRGKACKNMRVLYLLRPFGQRRTHIYVVAQLSESAAADVPHRTVGQCHGKAAGCIIIQAQSGSLAFVFLCRAHFLYLKVYHASALQRHGQKHAFVL